MPGKIKVKILAGRNLPVMDRSGDTTDAYVEIKFGTTTYKTDVCRKSLNPQWNSEWYRFEVDDAELQDEPLQVRLMDHDTYSANDAIGKVYVNLNPLLLPGLPPAVKNIWTLEATMNSSSGAQGGSVMTGWIPVFDTMHGIRGEVNIIVKVELFSDCNKFRQSSCGVQFFFSPNIPHGYHAQVIHGFVEELVVSDDPEYKWIDKIRTPRASNEARQTLFFKLSGEVQRKIGLKALDLGGNAVIGYVQKFDLEGESGIVARGIGTAVTLVKLQDITSSIPLESSNIEELTRFDLQPKNQLDLSETDDSLPLLCHSPNHSPLSLSPINFDPTTVSRRFPRYDKTRRYPRHAFRVAEYRAAGLRARRLSLEPTSTGNNPRIKIPIGSTLSLADDFISESSLRNMLALEDQRGEPIGNSFYRGLKNFRNLHHNILPRTVAQIKSKISDSFDDESDFESNYSSTWSLAGSESNRSSSIVDLRQSMRKKKFTHKKMGNDGIAALLIRSVHSGFPLDSVREDRETPTPSPVNFLTNTTEYTDECNKRGITFDKDNDQFIIDDDKSDLSRSEEIYLENQILVGKNKNDVKYTTGELLIPMISSSETDTSSSDDDEPSESSTNYNILDDRYSLLMDPSSNDDTTYQSDAPQIHPKDTEFSDVCHKTQEENFISEKLANLREIVNENDKIVEISSKPDFILESSTDYNILDCSDSTTEHSSIDDVKIEPSSRGPIEISELLETTNTLERVFETNENLEISVSTEDNRRSCSRIITDYGERSEIESVYPNDEKFHSIFQRSVDVTKLSENLVTVEPISTSQLERTQNHWKNNETVGTSRGKDCSSSTLRDCHSTSSTNYYFLDESYSPNDNNSADDGNNQTNLPLSIVDAKDSGIHDTCVVEIASSIFQTVDELMEKNKIFDNDNIVKNKISSVSLDRKIFESSNDKNVLDDDRYPKKFYSIDDCDRCQTNVQRDLGVVPICEISSDSALILSSSSEIQTATKEKDSEPMIGENTSPTVIDELPIFRNLDKNDGPLLHSAGKSTSSASQYSPSTTPTKFKHLKFLPKQKHFDNTEDAGFVTSTPVDTAITIFPEFETKKNVQSSKIHSQPSTSSIAIKKSNDESSKSETLYRTSQSHVSPVKREKKIVSTDKLVEYTDRQVCPLGISFGTIGTINEKKPVKPGIPSKSEKNELIDVKSTFSKKSIVRKKNIVDADSENTTTKKDKSSRKIVRTDTVIYKGPTKNRDDEIEKSRRMEIRTTRPTSAIPIVVAPPTEEHATRLQVPVVKTTNVNVQSTFSSDEMKIQHFGGTGNRKFPLDEWSMSDRFNRKYRQHCILDLIKTIDAKMMLHHGHHERRDSTKSKKKKRERINASATPSPDSIHRIRSHKRRSKSRSPDRQHGYHNKNQISSLSTHSFPNSAIYPNKHFSSANFPQDSTSCNSSCENISRNTIFPTIPVRPKIPGFSVKENLSSPANINLQSNNNNNNDNNKIIVGETVTEKIHDQSLANSRNNELESDLTLRAVADSLMLDPKEVERKFGEIQTRESLENLSHDNFLTTKTTNTSNKIDDLRVPCSSLTLRQQDEQQTGSPVQAASALPTSLGSKVPANTTTTTTTKTNTVIPNMNRRSSDSDLSITPKGNSLAGSDRSMGGYVKPSTAIVRTMNQDTMEMLEYPFITMQQYPSGFVLNIGGLVSARSVKLLERITNLEEPESRDAWWTEIRMEVRSHARALACNVVLGYKEEISICDDVCVLNASGTAAVINLLNPNQDQENVLLSRNLMTTSVENEREKINQIRSINVKNEKNDETSLSGQQQTHSSVKTKRTSESNDHETPYLAPLNGCNLCHLPYNEASVPFRVDVSKCALCRRAKVPDVLFTTIELPENIPMTGRGVFVQATVCKSKRDLRGELNAKEISDCLPFLEYELHSLLLNKLKVKGMNAIFGLKVQVSVGERLVIGMAVGTAVYLTALPTPSVPQIASGNAWHNDEQLAEIQKTLIETVKKNREFYRLKPIVDVENGRSITTSDTDESDDDLPDLDLGIGTKDACVLEVDDVEDMDRINLLIDERPPDDFHVVNTQMIPGLEDLEIVRNLQMFTQISRTKIPSGQFASMPSKYFAKMLQTVLFKLRRMVPCALCDMQFRVALPEQDEIQLSVVGMALGLGEPTKLGKYNKRKLVTNSTSKDPIKRTDDNDMIFSLEEDQADIATGCQDSCPAPNQSNPSISCSSPLPSANAQKHRPRSPFKTKTHMTHRHKHVPLKERYGVDITPLSYLPGGKIERYLGNINFFFIRESTSIRENGGLSGFTHSFVTEILAIVRAHITALGGDAMVAFFMTQCVLLHSPHKNQGQCLINVGGDVVTVSYYENDKYQGNQNC